MADGSKRSSLLFVSSCSGQVLESLQNFIRTQRPCSNEILPALVGPKRPLSLFVSSCSGQGLDRFTSQLEHKGRVQFERLQRLSTLNGHFRFSCLAATRRNSDISLFHRNTKSVFPFKSSNISVSKRSSPLFRSSCSGQNLRLFHPFD